MLLPHLEWSVNPSSTAPSLLALFTRFWLMELLTILGNGSKSNGLPHGVLTIPQLKKWSLGYSLGSPLEVLRCVGHVRQYGSSAVPSPLAQQGTPCICTSSLPTFFSLVARHVPGRENIAADSLSQDKPHVFFFTGSGHGIPHSIPSVGHAAARSASPSWRSLFRSSFEMQWPTLMSLKVKMNNIFIYGFQWG